VLGYLAGMTLTALGPGWLPLIERAARALAEDGGAALDADRARQIGTYLDELVTWGRRIDLTAARTAEELVDLTVADALVIAGHVVHRPADGPRSFVDVGAGAGAPGVPLALLWPSGRGTLVEPRDKRVAFLRTVVGRLALPIEVVRSRSEALPARGWEVAVSRATLPPPAWLAEGTRLARDAVWVLLAREGPPSIGGWCPIVDFAYAWPLTGVGRRAVCYAPEAS
jgi:16S rRNA (guanine527-N7)-methyltransferase